jgi:nicotinate-nucleotide adenylyltransferase
MNIAVLGGSFNPPHICHLFISCYVLASVEVDQVWLLPCYKHAFRKELAPFHHRFTMCCLTLELLQEHRVHVSAIEKERQETSWTIDTVRDLKMQYPDDNFTWIIGSDVLLELKQWKDFDHLASLISFLVVPRSGFSSDFSDSIANIERLEFQLPNISSSLIRKRIKNKQSIESLVPKHVAEYIRMYKLYDA